MKVKRQIQPAWLTDRRAGWVLTAAVVVPVIVGALVIYVLHSRDSLDNSRSALVTPSVVATTPSTVLEAPRRTATVNARLIGVLIHPTDSRQSSARITSSGITGTYRLGDQVAGAVLEAIESDHVILQVAEDKVVLGLVADNASPKAQAKVDHQKNFELARQIPGAIPTGEPTFRDTPLPPAEGNAAFKAALQKAREDVKQ